MAIENGFFIVFEGVDGSGKTTQANILYERLVTEGYSCTLTEEPGATKEGEIIKELLLNPDFKLTQKTELFLFLADRAQHVHKVIKPALNSGDIVISSRYFFSTLVYQGYARKVASIDFLEELNLFATDNTFPNLVFYIDVLPEERLSLAKNESSKKFGSLEGDRIEMEGLEFQNRVREGYLLLAKKYGEMFRVIDGRGDILEINNLIYDIVKEVFNRGGIEK